MELVDPPTIGGKFTWRNICGSAMSRLDRFLLLDKFIDDWKVEGQTIGERDVSDHAPIWMKDNKRNWGPKSFRFNNLWFNHDNFIHFVEVEWKKIVVMGRGDFCLVEKLKALKSQIVKWNKEVYGWINLNIEEAGKEMHFLDNKFAHFAGNVSEEVVVERSIVAIDFWDNLCKKEGFLRQKLRQLLLTEGDCNTCYFHNSLKDRRRRNSLCALDSRGGILKKVSEVKGFIFNHFKSFFNEEAEGRPNLSGLSLKALSGWESLNIERLFTELEVKDAIWSCDGNKSAGPDALIPKINNTQNLGEYLPICLVGSIYRIISKILAARLKEVIGTLVSNNQTAFVSGRNMMDSVLLVNELIDWSRRKKRSCILLNVDIEKAYDSVSWKYLRDMMMRMGFGDMWMRWMDTCIFMSHMSVLVNGSATKEFKVHKGLRQGDPLSPFLFVLAMKGLKALVRKSIEMGDLKPFNYGEEDYVDILQFADDTIILGEDSCDNLWNMKVLLRGFELVSGLKTNFAKSNILGVNVGDWFINATTTFLSCKKGGIPFKFLGIMVGESLRKKKVWLEVINKIKGRLSSWKGSNISMGGRVPLINLVLNAIPTFTLSFFKAPGKVIKEIRRLQSDFLWSEKLDKKSIHWVKWKNVCRSKEKGGLGVRDVGEVNKALLLKWKWRILRKDNAIWSRFLLLRYHCPKLKVQVPSGEMSRSDDSIWWRDINKNNVIDDLVDSADVLVWTNGTHKWNLEALFGSSTTHGTAVVAVTTARPCWNQFCAKLDSFTPSKLENGTFLWCINLEKEFSVASISNIVSVSKSFAWAPYLFNLLKVMWELKIPPKLKVFAWRFFIERLPSKDQLMKRGVNTFTNTDCVFCGNHPENFSHLFFNCQVVKEIWKHIYGWLGIMVELNGEEFMDFGAIQEKVKKANHRVNINFVWIAIIWCIWLMRNAVIFKGKVFCFDVVCSNIIFLSWK
ncbi:uncharacterized protein LOC131648523 [Vicia villosa]|uniref:uncharacterized protein LOC131648523 n=1 Tax=Vicia villosa TaxID=3911 RepID=UPI00273C4E70|nr:uncharacterized protein LOC131648523 [Vicia villosa]